MIRISNSTPIHTYELLEEIHATQATTYIDTGINTSTDISIEVYYNTGAAQEMYSRIFGCSTLWSNPETMAVDYEAGDMHVKFITDTDWQSLQITWSANEDHTIFLSSTQFKYDNVQYLTFTPSTISTYGEIRLLQSSMEGLESDEQGYYKLYHVKIWDNDTLVRHYVPAKRLSDNVYGMYDMVNSTFNVSDGTGQFTGTSKTTPEYIDDNSSLYVNKIIVDGVEINKIYNNGNVYFGNVDYQTPTPTPTPTVLTSANIRTANGFSPSQSISFDKGKTISTVDDCLKLTLSRSGAAEVAIGCYDSIRLYKNAAITFVSDYSISQIKFTLDTHYVNTTSGMTQPYTIDLTNHQIIYNVNAKTKTISPGSYQMRFTQIEVIYA